MNARTAEIAVDTPCACGEGPLWHSDEKVLLWTDIPNGRLHRYDPASGRHDVRLDDDRPIGGFTIQADGSLLLFRDRGNVVAFRDHQLAETVIESIPAEDQTRFNDLIADPEGRVFAGTLGKTPGNLYRIDLDGSYEPLVGGLGCSNGLDFTADLSTMYFIDTVPNRIDAFDYDRATGALANRRQIASLGEGQGKPDGMTLDAEGRLWVAAWGGRGVYGFAYDPAAGGDAEPLGKAIDVPTQNVTSLCFAGDDLKDIYVTSAGGGQRDADNPHAGSLFHARGEVGGKAGFRSRIGA